jgi:hypothetical protein
MPEKENKYQTMVNCFIYCPYQLQCGVAISRNFLSCRDKIKAVIPEAERLEARPLYEVLVFDREDRQIATISKGKIIEI